METGSGFGCSYCFFKNVFVCTLSDGHSRRNTCGICVRSCGCIWDACVLCPVGASGEEERINGGVRGGNEKFNFLYRRFYD